MQAKDPRLPHRAEVYLMLARAWQAPMHQAQFEAIRDWLAEDLAAAASEAGYPESASLAPLAAAVAQHAQDHSGLLRGYSELFLIPPTRVHLNAGVYLDRALMGAHAIELLEWHQRHGVERRDDFHNTPDHLAALLEFAALLADRAAAAATAGRDDEAQAAIDTLRGLLGRHLAPWMGYLAAALGREADLGEPSRRVYVALGGVLRDVVADDLAWLWADASGPAGVSAGPREVTPRVADGHSADGLRAMIEHLEAAGLDASHLRARLAA
jgi:TorA maturation chaperone TorD